MLSPEKAAPLVSCIMPTYNRRAFVPYAIRYFLQQDYPSKELIILDDGSDKVNDLVPESDCIHYYRLPKKLTLGAKMNMACTYAKGDIIVNWDDDDWYAPWRLSYQVAAMQDEVSVCGINQLLYFDLRSQEGYQYIYPSNQKLWLLGSSLCYTRQAWLNNSFADTNVGMDGLFVWATPPEQVRALDNQAFAVHMIHGSNVSPKQTSGGFWHAYPIAELRTIVGKDWSNYVNDNVIDKRESAGFRPQQTPQPLGSYKLLKNVYACLVHESGNCVLDLVRNLRYHDPDSEILLYNGGNEKHMLVNAAEAFKKYKVHIHPASRPQQHGYLHGFALDCMEYCIANMAFDVLTIVDSDQLCLRKGYPDFISRFLAGAPKVGMLSSDARRVTAQDKSNHIAAQAFKELELWQSLVDNFKESESPFVHWTFWPATVFTKGACNDLLTLFQSNMLLQRIMRETKIWATEEVILPTLVRYLGYEIGDNPSSLEFVKYRTSFNPKDVQRAARQDNVFWMHPVERKFTNPLRAFIRARSNEYQIPENAAVFQTENSIDTAALVRRIRHIQGWLSDREAALLIEFAQKTLRLFNAPTFVETGSYHGKTTVLFGKVLQAFSTAGKLYAIDSHDGKLGAADQGLTIYPPSFEQFKKNIKAAAVSDRIEIVKARPVDVSWKSPIAFLFIDGLHDYPNVSNEFRHFERCLENEACIAFHDYADYFPGVKQLVEELISSNEYERIQQADSLVFLQKK